MNKPGLPALQYRVGTFGTFRQAMLDYLVRHPVSNPSPGDPSQTFTLTSRSSDDYGVAMLELWAYVCDVLTFYQQAIANEVFLRTATQQTSVARIAALLGYRPAPPLAASVYLAFLTSRGAAATIPAGLQVQSEPDPGQLPVVYETSDPVAATAVNNQLTLLGPITSVALDQSGVLLNDGPSNPLAQGNRLVFFNSSQGVWSEQQITSVVAQPVGKLITWRGSLSGLSPASQDFNCYRLGRSFRCFGCNAPATYLTLDTSSGPPAWTSQKSDFQLPQGAANSSFLWLDGVYTGLGVGSFMLITYDGPPPQLLFGAIAAVANGSQTLGPVTGSSTGIMLTTIEGSLPPGADRRNVNVYELLGPSLAFASMGFDQTSSPSYPPGTQTIYILDASGLAVGTDLILSSNGPSGVAGEVATVAAPGPSPILQSGVTLAYSVKLANGLMNGYDASATSVYANIAAATQGKTQPIEVLGSGDTPKQWQEFALRNTPVTYIASAAAGGGAASTLRVFVDNVQWNEVESFYGRRPNDQVFVTHVGDDGTYYVRFGDGITGQRVPTGNRNVTALYRTGAGSNGNEEAAGISTILQSVTGLQSVTNPLPAVGGGDGESISRTRQNAPVSVLTLGRAVSLADYEALALSYRNGIVTKVRASWADLGDRRGVALTTAAAGAQPLGQLTQPLRSFLDQHRDPNVPLTIADVAVVYFVFRAIIHVQAGNLQSVVKSAVETALGVGGDRGYLSYAQLNIGESIYLSKLLAALQNAAGVDWVQLQEFSTVYSSGRIGFSPKGNVGPLPFPLGTPGAGHKKLDVIYIDPRQIAQPSLTGVANDISVDLQFSGGVNDL